MENNEIQFTQVLQELKQNLAQLEAHFSILNCPERSKQEEGSLEQLKIENQKLKAELEEKKEKISLRFSEIAELTKLYQKAQAKVLELEDKNQQLTATVKTFYLNQMKDNLDYYKQLILKSGLFDENYYKRDNPDLKDNIDLLEHFILYGRQEERDPSANFRTRYYLEANEDVRNSNVHPLIHYIRYGQVEGRLARRPRLNKKTKAGKKQKRDTTS